MRPHKSASHETPRERNCNASPPPMLTPPVPSMFTLGRSAALASSTYCRDCATRTAVTRSSGLFVIASAISASSCGSPKAASQLSAIGPASAPAFHEPGSAMFFIASCRTCWGVGGALMAQPISRAALSTPSIDLTTFISPLVQLQNQPVELRPDAHDDFAQNMNRLAGVGIDRAVASRARRQEYIFFLLVKMQAHGKMAGWNGGNAGAAAGPTDRQLPLGRGPHDGIDFAFDDAAGKRRNGDFRLLTGCDAPDFVLSKDGHDPLLVFDKRHGGHLRKLYGHRAGPQSK